MSQNNDKLNSDIFQKVKFFSSFKNDSPKQPPPHQDLTPRPSIFATLKKKPSVKPNDFIPLFCDCISAASCRTQEYLAFKDPENKFHPSAEVLTQVQ